MDDVLLERTPILTDKDPRIDESNAGSVWWQFALDYLLGTCARAYLTLYRRQKSNKMAGPSKGMTSSNSIGAGCYANNLNCALLQLVTRTTHYIRRSGR